MSEIKFAKFESVRKAWRMKATARATGERDSSGALWRGTSRNRASKRKEIMEEDRGGKIRGGSYERGARLGSRFYEGG